MKKKISVKESISVSSVAIFEQHQHFFSRDVQREQ